MEREIRELDAEKEQLEGEINDKIRNLEYEKKQLTYELKRKKLIL